MSCWLVSHVLNSTSSGSTTLIVTQFSKWHTGHLYRWNSTVLLPMFLPLFSEMSSSQLCAPWPQSILITPSLPGQPQVGGSSCGTREMQLCSQAPDCIICENWFTLPDTPHPPCVIIALVIGIGFLDWYSNTYNYIHLLCTTITNSTNQNHNMNNCIEIRLQQKQQT